MLEAYEKHLRMEYKHLIEKSNTPFWAFAIHDGHQIDDELLPYLLADDDTRLREEDPHTGTLAELPFNRFIAATSRFQLDLNRIRKDAVYLRPDQAWGISVYDQDLPTDLINTLHETHDAMFKQIDALVQETIQQHGYFVIYDIHSYNAKRKDQFEEIDQDQNPEINLGTAHNNPKWRDLINAFIGAVRKQEVGLPLVDIRENIKFNGGYLAKYITDHYGAYGCVLSIEFRKDFMDEWTGQVYPEKLQSYKQLLLHTSDMLHEYFANEERK